MSTADPIYLDFNASTPILPAVLEAMLPYLHQHYGNPSSGHVFGQRAAAAVARARVQVAALLGCHDDEVIFTSGGTESNNLAIRGVAAACRHKRHIVTSVVEHPAVEQPCQHLERQGWTIYRAAVDGSGQVDAQAIAAAITPETSLVTIMHAQNETGALQPIAAISRALQGSGVLLHSDAAQAVGKVPTSVDELGVDLLSVAGHKLYAPKGVGALFVRRGTPLHPVTFGAGHERGLRPGTESVALIAGLGEACALAERTLQQERARVQQLRDALFVHLREAIPGVALNGPAGAEERLPNTLNLRFPGARGSAVLARATAVAASTGSACHAGGERPSAVLLAQGLSEEQALGSVRLSLGRSTTAEEVARAAESLIQAYRALAD